MIKMCKVCGGKFKSGIAGCSGLVGCSDVIESRTQYTCENGHEFIDFEIGGHKWSEEVTGYNSQRKFIGLHSVRENDDGLP